MYKMYIIQRLELVKGYKFVDQQEILIVQNRMNSKTKIE
jgi:hypothetical protein